MFKFIPNNNETLVRIFPMEEYRNNLKKQKLKFGIISVKNDSNIKLENDIDVLDNIPCKVKYNVIVPSKNGEKYCNAIEINKQI